MDKYIKKCEVEELSTTVMNMEFLDRYKNPDLQPLICRESGIIVGCSPDVKETGLKWTVRGRLVTFSWSY